MQPNLPFISKQWRKQVFAKRNMPGRVVTRAWHFFFFVVAFVALQTVTIGIHRGTWCPKKLCVNLSPFNKTIIVLKIIFKIYIVCLYLKSTPLMTCQAFGACCCCWGFCGLSVVCTVCPSVVAALPLLLTCITHTHTHAQWSVIKWRVLCCYEFTRTVKRYQKKILQ